MNLVLKPYLKLAAWLDGLAPMLPLMYLAMLLALLFGGAGRWSLDHCLAGKLDSRRG